MGLGSSLTAPSFPDILHIKIMSDISEKKGGDREIKDLVIIRLAHVITIIIYCPLSTIHNILYSW